MSNNTKSKHSKTELETIIRQGNFSSQSSANSYLQQYGLSAQMKDDGTAEILDDQSNRVASVKFQGSGSDQRSISNIEITS